MSRPNRWILFGWFIVSHVCWFLFGRWTVEGGFTGSPWPASVILVAYTTSLAALIFNALSMPSPSEDATD